MPRWTASGFSPRPLAVDPGIADHPHTRDALVQTIEFAVAALLAGLAATQLYGKQIYLFDLYEGFFGAERQRLGLPGTQLFELSEAPNPLNTLYVQRRWAIPHLKTHQLIVRRRSAAVG
jgi:hypothetical protein